jgi:hypothetical protein
MENVTEQVHCSSETKENEDLMTEKLLKCMMGITSGKEGMETFLSRKGMNYLNKLLEEELNKEQNQKKLQFYGFP